MARLHIFRTRNGVLISPITDPLVLQYFEQFVPGYLWRPLYRHDAALVDVVLADLSTVLPLATYGIRERCEECHAGHPCSTLLEQAQAEAESLFVRPSYTREMPAIKDTHYLRLFDCMNRPCGALLDPTKRFRTTLDNYLLVGYHYDTEIRAWYIDKQHIEGTRAYLGDLRPSLQWCEICERGVMCPAWDPCLMMSEGYKIHSAVTPKTRPKSLDTQAARVLQISLPASRKAVEDAFRCLALKAHPDQGGTDEQMRELLEARERLARRA